MMFGVLVAVLLALVFRGVRRLVKAFSPDGGSLVTASRDGTVKVWEAEPRDVRPGQ
jgi:WD40 repeat protein